MIQSKHGALPKFDPFQDQGPVPSPCISVCKMDAANVYCEGCLRTIDEIIAWSSATDSTKRVIWGEIARRAQELV